MLKSAESHRFLIENGGFSGCGGRIRTNDLRVMSPTSYQLLYPAIFICAPLSLDIIPRWEEYVNTY